ncbi:mannitol-1-phosphate 5-dehydrogenase, partial [Escherichia coli NE098]
MPDATLMRLIMPTGLNRRSDKALAPHPTPCS